MTRAVRIGRPYIPSSPGLVDSDSSSIDDLMILKLGLFLSVKNEIIVGALEKVFL